MPDPKPRTYQAPAPYCAEPRPPIELHRVVSSQVRAIGYDEATRTLAVTFVHGVGSVYHYPDVPPAAYAAFKAASSIGSFFGQHIKRLPFKKYRAETAAA